MNACLKTMAKMAVATLALCWSWGSHSVWAQEEAREYKYQEEDGFVWYKVREKGRNQVLDANRNVLIPFSRGYSQCNYEARGGYFKTSSWKMVGEKGVAFYGICLKDGTEVIPLSRKYTQCFRNKSGGRYTVKKGECVGVCDSTGAEIISPDRGYTQCTRNRQFYQVNRGDYSGMCDYQTGAELISPKRKYTSCRYNPAWKCFCVKKGERSGACSLDGKEIVSPVWYSCIFNTTTKKWKGKRTLNSSWEDIH